MSIGVQRGKGELQHLQGLLAYSLDPILVVEPFTLNILEVNALACEWLKYEPDKLTTLTLRDVLASENIEEQLSSIGDICKQNTVIAATLIRADRATLSAQLTFALDVSEDLEVAVVTIRRKDAGLGNPNEDRSHESYRTMFENFVDVYYETTLEGQIIEVSPSIERFGPFSREELIGKSMLSFYSDEGRRIDLISELAQKGEVNDFEIDLTNKDGQNIPCSITSKLKRDENGTPYKIVGTMRDVSERKFSERRTRAELQSLEMIAKDSPIEEILENLVLRMEALSPDMLCSILLLDDEARLHIGAAPSLPDDYNAAIEGLEIGPDVGSCGTAAFTKKRVIVSNIETDPLWSNFKDLALAHNLRSCWSQPILSSTGKVLGTFAIYYPEPREPSDLNLQMIESVTHLAAIALERTYVQAEQRDLEAQMRQAQKLESLGVLAGGIAHDFNNLLTGVIGYASLATQKLTEEGSDALKHVVEIQKVALRAADLTKQMLAYSGRGKFVVRPLSVSHLVEELTQLLSISISKKARLSCEFSEELPAIAADAAQLQQVVMNLITNASEALGDEPGEIAITTGLIDATEEYLNDSQIDTEIPAGKYVYVEVADSGCGMDQQTVSKIFDPFFTTKFTGRGLGMSAVLGIMRGHKGTIKIDTVPGKGTTIRILFPSFEKVKQVETSQPHEGNDTVDPEWSGRGVVLVVDDEEFVREMATAILRTVGYDVKTAVDGQDCLDVYEKHRDVVVAILLDLTMPTMDGIQVIHELKQRGSKVPVVLSSGYNVQEVRKRMNGDSFEAFLQKPYLRSALIDTIRSVILA